MSFWRATVSGNDLIVLNILVKLVLLNSVRQGVSTGPNELRPDHNLGLVE